MGLFGFLVSSNPVCSLMAFSVCLGDSSEIRSEILPERAVELQNN